MGKKKHPFIDKKTALRFNVVHRSQRDPLQPDEESSQHVLVPADGSVEDTAENSEQCSSKQQKMKYGIYYDDDYDYLQHLRPRGEGFLIMADDVPTPRPPSNSKFGNLNLPKEVLPSNYEEDIGMLNKGVLPRGPQPDWDPDIVRLLDEDVVLDDADNLLEDDFILMANQESEQDYFEEDKLVFNKFEHMEGFEHIYGRTGTLTTGTNNEDNSDDKWETASDVSSRGNLDYDLDISDCSEEETKSCFTSYSMTSSVIRRTEGLRILDDRFERIMEEYDDGEVGPVEQEELVGTLKINDDLMNNIVEEFIQEQTKIPFEETVNDEAADIVESSDDKFSEDDDNLCEEFQKVEKEQFDCESIISTYSNLYNHPKIIDEKKSIKLNEKTGLPIGVLKDKQNKEYKEQKLESIVLNNVRKQGESGEEKKARKQEVKKFRKERRKEKKINKTFFENEGRKQELTLQNKGNLIIIP